LAWYYNKSGIVLWGQSDPRIFGHIENINLLKNNRYLRKDTFGTWGNVPYDAEAFVSPAEVLDALEKF
jgi:hypothetical protein